MTIWAAVANFEEQATGSLEPGKKADFVVFNRDLKNLTAKEFKGYELRYTFFDGRMVFDSQQ